MGELIAQRPPTGSGTTYQYVVAYNWQDATAGLVKHVSGELVPVLSPVSGPA